MVACESTTHEDSRYACVKVFTDLYVLETTLFDKDNMNPFKVHRLHYNAFAPNFADKQENIVTSIPANFFGYETR